MTQHGDLFAALLAPFDPGEVKLRTQAGRKLSYVTARTVMNRLDDVIGPENWWDEYPIVTEHSVYCRLTIRLPDGQVVTKSDAGGMAGMADPGDDDKSGFADAFKRAAVKFGVGRYLYGDGVPRFAPGEPRGPTEGRQDPRPSPREDRPAAPRDGDRPTTGAALYKWVKAKDEELGGDLLKRINAWAKRQGWPWKMTEWDAAQVAAAFEQTCLAIHKLTVQPVTQAEADMSDREWEGDRE